MATGPVACKVPFQTTRWRTIFALFRRCRRKEINREETKLCKKYWRSERWWRLCLLFVKCVIVTQNEKIRPVSEADIRWLNDIIHCPQHIQSVSQHQPSNPRIQKCMMAALVPQDRFSGNRDNDQQGQRCCPEKLPRNPCLLAHTYWLNSSEEEGGGHLEVPPQALVQAKTKLYTNSVFESASSQLSVQ